MWRSISASGSSLVTELQFSFDKLWVNLGLTDVFSDYLILW